MDRYWAGTAKAVVIGLCILFSGAAQASIGPSIAKRAARLVGVKKLSTVTQRVPDDCSGVVRLPYMSEGVNLLEGEWAPDLNAVGIIHQRAIALGALAEGAPLPGDLAFFKETYDRNRDGKRNDGLTHVAIVESVAPDGTVTLVHHGKQGVARTYLNTSAPETFRDATGRKLNSILVLAKGKTKRYLTSELFMGYARADALAQKLPSPVSKQKKSRRRDAGVRLTGSRPLRQGEQAKQEHAAVRALHDRMLIIAVA